MINVGDAVPPNPAGYVDPATQPYVYVLFTPAETDSLVSYLPYTVLIQVVDSYGNPYDVEEDTWQIHPGLTG